MLSVGEGTAGHSPAHAMGNPLDGSMAVEASSNSSASWPPAGPSSKVALSYSSPSPLHHDSRSSRAAPEPYAQLCARRDPTVDPLTAAAASTVARTSPCGPTGYDPVQRIRRLYDVVLKGCGERGGMGDVVVARWLCGGAFPLSHPPTGAIPVHEAAVHREIRLGCRCPACHHHHTITRAAIPEATLRRELDQVPFGLLPYRTLCSGLNEALPV